MKSFVEFDRTNDLIEVLSRDVSGGTEESNEKPWSR
jgi:hypothetical protein